MPRTPNPLREMTYSIKSDTPAHVSFQETALPGFKLALQARRSVREYGNQSMPEAVMRDCLSDSILAPTSSNFQTYELYWVRTPEKYDPCHIGGMDKVRIAKLLRLPSKADVTIVIAAGRGKPEGIYGPRVRLSNSELINEV